MTKRTDIVINSIEEAVSTLDSVNKQLCEHGKQGLFKLAGMKKLEAQDIPGKQQSWKLFMWYQD